MPRKRLTPTTGGNSNRTDQPVQAATGQAYGEAKAQTDAQKAVPLPNQAGRMQQMLEAARSHPMAKLTGLSAPTERPDEPFTSGLSMGEGPGPEVLGPEDPGTDPDLQSAAEYLPILELMSSLPGASVATRNFIRRIRGAQVVPQLPEPSAPPPEVV